MLIILEGQGSIRDLRRKSTFFSKTNAQTFPQENLLIETVFLIRIGL
jgi:hypothetical protein